MTYLATAGALAGGSPVVGCTPLEGGAVELSWTVRGVAGDSIDGCGDGADGGALIERVRLCWLGPGDGGLETMACPAATRATFACASKHGATGFELAPGPTAFWIEPLCADGDPAAAASAQVPAPIVRDVQVGQIVTLNSLLIVLEVATACVREAP